MLPVRYQSLGQYDHAVDVTIDVEGRYDVSGGTYVSRGRGTGRLSAQQRAGLDAALRALDPDHTRPIPEAAEGFVRELVIGTTPEPTVVRWWGPVSDDDPTLARIVRMLDAL
ncbi:MAG: hypothetical protein GVY18_03490 [Bacteroidetes bacterium]|jgi:hypothetical protein|nr:hypothetical protein [Bacteroidota bacterium]